jgi:hypothetical protein
MLIDQYDPNILPFGCKPVKGRLDRRIVRLAVHYEEVLLGVRRRRDMLQSSFNKKDLAAEPDQKDSPRFPREAAPLPSPGAIISATAMTTALPTYLVANNSQELSVLVVGLGCRRHFGYTRG